MKKSRFIFIPLLLFFSCGHHDHIPDVSGIKVDLKLHRFDQDFFSIDSNQVEPGLEKMYRQYPGLTPLFLHSILGISDSASVNTSVKHFLHLAQPMKDSINDVFPNMDGILSSFQQAFRFVKYYFPGYSLPDLATVTGPVDALAETENGYSPDFLRPGLLGISLQFYLGKNYSLYQDQFFMDNVAPTYRSRRFSKEYIIADGMSLIVSDLFPDSSRSQPLIERMVERGKRWYLLDKFLPETPDSIKTGYTGVQLEWCRSNEGLIWSELIRNGDLNSISPEVIQTYLSEGPFTQGFSQEYSPGNLGQWIGWQIVKKFAEKKGNPRPEVIMRTSAREILDEAKYKPR
jgi:hypothetical protein